MCRKLYQASTSLLSLFSQNPEVSICASTYPFNWSRSFEQFSDFETRIDTALGPTLMQSGTFDVPSKVLRLLCACDAMRNARQYM